MEQPAGNYVTPGRHYCEPRGSVAEGCVCRVVLAMPAEPLETVHEMHTPYPCWTCLTLPTLPACHLPLVQQLDSRMLALPPHHHSQHTSIYTWSTHAAACCSCLLARRLLSSTRVMTALHTGQTGTGAAGHYRHTAAVQAAVQAVAQAAVQFLAQAVAWVLVVVRHSRAARSHQQAQQQQQRT
jgi:hypothetical protein